MVIDLIQKIKNKKKMFISQQRNLTNYSDEAKIER